MIAPELQERLRASKHLVVFTGAGMSAESGIPTFRDRAEGLWAKVDPAEVATPHAFRKNPQFVWDWHVHLADGTIHKPLLDVVAHSAARQLGQCGEFVDGVAGGGCLVHDLLYRHLYCQCQVSL